MMQDSAEYYGGGFLGSRVSEIDDLLVRISGLETKVMMLIDSWFIVSSIL